jgi:hypothetical protein
MSIGMAFKQIERAIRKSEYGRLAGRERCADNDCRHPQKCSANFPLCCGGAMYLQV